MTAGWQVPAHAQPAGLRSATDAEPSEQVLSQAALGRSTTSRRILSQEESAAIVGYPALPAEPVRLLKPAEPAELEAASEPEVADELVNARGPVQSVQTVEPDQPAVVSLEAKPLPKESGAVRLLLPEEMAIVMTQEAMAVPQMDTRESAVLILMNLPPVINDERRR